MLMNGVNRFRFQSIFIITGLVINNRYCSLTIHNKNEAALAAVFIKELGEEC